MSGGGWHDRFDVIVVGAGHAGCEAALAAARIGRRTLLLTMSLDTIAQMSCNPAIGGLGKGQLVREIDALGGEMARVIDASGIMFRMLNTAKGPAVRAPRAQADKKAYQARMKLAVEACPGLLVRQHMVQAIEVEGGRVIGVATRDGLRYGAGAVVITAGTFLKGLVHVGTSSYASGRAGESASDALSDSFRGVGLEVRRFKTGTPPRLNGRTVDTSQLERQVGDPLPQPFSYTTPAIEREQVDCWISWTGEASHQLIRDNLHRSPLYDGQIEGTGPRYCPSIEDKVVKFADRDRHQVFLEPEGAASDTLEWYVNGISTSLPPDVQDRLVASIPGCERAQIIRYGYAIEYDYAPPTQLHPSLETRGVERLYFAGQVNGTSGYEEAAAQGLIAGINAARRVADEAPLVLGREEAYIGVMIDDLVTRGVIEPYRMFTSRAEYRLLLRQDNADRRLLRRGHEVGLIGAERVAELDRREARIAELRRVLASTHRGNHSLEQLLRRPQVGWAELVEQAPELGGEPAAVAEQVEIEVKYEGYIKRQRRQVEKLRALESRRIPDEVDYSQIVGLRTEAAERLARVRPASIGQASRISGVNPVDLDVLWVAIKALAKPS